MNMGIAQKVYDIMIDILLEHTLQRIYGAGAAHTSLCKQTFIGHHY